VGIQTSEVGEKISASQRGGHGVNADRSSKEEELLKTPSCVTPTYESGERFNIKIQFLFYGDNSRTVALR
jgi:hypothetical protein